MDCVRPEKKKKKKEDGAWLLEGKGRQDGDMNWTGKSLVSNACHIRSRMKV